MRGKCYLKNEVMYLKWEWVIKEFALFEMVCVFFVLGAIASPSYSL
jgi:hypothetical protein